MVSFPSHHLWKKEGFGAVVIRRVCRRHNVQEHGVLEQGGVDGCVELAG